MCHNECDRKGTLGHLPVRRSLRLRVFVAKELEELKRAVDGGTRIISLSGLTSVSAKAYVLARLRAETRRRFAVVTESNGDIDTWSADLAFCASQISDLSFEITKLPSFETDPYSGVSPHAETEERRALSLWQIAKGDPEIIVLSARSLIQRTITPAQIDELWAPRSFAMRISRPSSSSTDLSRAVTCARTRSSARASSRSAAASSMSGRRTAICRSGSSSLATRSTRSGASTRTRSFPSNS